MNTEQQETLAELNASIEADPAAPYTARLIRERDAILAEQKREGERKDAYREIDRISRNIVELEAKLAQANREHVEAMERAGAIGFRHFIEAAAEVTR